MNWREKIEAQIAEMIAIADEPDTNEYDREKLNRWARSLRRITDVAVAAEKLYEVGYDGVGLMQAFDKLREVSDE